VRIECVEGVVGEHVGSARLNLADMLIRIGSPRTLAPHPERFAERPQAVPVTDVFDRDAVRATDGISALVGPTLMTDTVDARGR